MRVIVLVLLVACNKGAGTAAPTKASCNTLATKICEDYEGKKSYLDGKQNECKGAGGEWSMTVCPTANVLGTCSETTASFTRSRHYYVGGGTVIEKTKVECGAFGKWIDPPAP